MFHITENDILNVYKEEGKFKEYIYCKDYLKFMKRDKNKPLIEEVNQYSVNYNSLLRWKNKRRIPYGIECLNFLNERKLLPYYPNETTSRIVGFLHGDGYLLQSLFSFGFVSKDRNVLLRLKKDVENEFNIKGKIKIKRDIGDIENINNKEVVVKYPTYELQFNNKPVCSLLYKLGVPKGKKISQGVFVQDWIMNGNSDLQKSFLQGLFDSELSNSKISTFKGHKENLSSPRMEMGKEKRLKINLEVYLNQISILLKNLNIDSKITYPREYKTGKISLTLLVSNRLLNLYNFVENIGFYYNEERKIESLIIKRISLKKIKRKNPIYKILRHISKKNEFTLRDLEIDLNIHPSITKLLGKYLNENNLVKRERQSNRWFQYTPNIEEITRIIDEPVLLEELPRIYK